MLCPPAQNRQRISDIYIVLWQHRYAPNGFHDGWYEAYALLAVHGVCWLQGEDISKIRMLGNTSDLHPILDDVDGDDSE